jgi:hypothetical protein
MEVLQPFSELMAGFVCGHLFDRIKNVLLRDMFEEVLRHMKLLCTNSMVVLGTATEGALSTNCFRYDYGKWREIIDYYTRRTCEHTSCVMADGNVMVCGGMGQNGEPRDHAMIWTRSRGAIYCPDMFWPRYLHCAVGLRDGRVMVSGGVVYSKVEIGGIKFRVSGSIEFYCPVDKKWTLSDIILPDLVTRGMLMVVLHSGDVLMMGSAEGLVDLQTTYIFEVDNSRFRRVSMMKEKRWEAAATLLPSGKVIVTGGASYDYHERPTILRTCEVYDPVSETWELGPPMNCTRRKHICVVLSDCVFVSGDIYSPMCEKLRSGATGWVITADVNLLQTMHAQVVAILDTHIPKAEFERYQ